jgi:hypothetical protein
MEKTESEELSDWGKEQFRIAHEREAKLWQNHLQQLDEARRARVRLLLDSLR